MESRHMPKLINRVTIRYIIYLLVAILIFVFVLSSCAPPPGMLEPTPVPPTPAADVNAEATFLDWSFKRVVDRDYGYICYVNSNGGVACFKLEE